VLGPFLHALDEEHWAAMEDQFDLALMLGRHQPTLPALVANAAAHPSRERTWAQLTVALYRSGRAADALQAYARMQHWLASDFDVTPSPLLQHLRHRIWSGDPTLCSGGWRSDAPEHTAHHGRGGVVAHAPQSVLPAVLSPTSSRQPGGTRHSVTGIPRRHDVTSALGRVAAALDHRRPLRAFVFRRAAADSLTPQRLLWLRQPIVHIATGNARLPLHTSVFLASPLSHHHLLADRLRINIGRHYVAQQRFQVSASRWCGGGHVGAQTGRFCRTPFLVCDGDR
jgi:hypothetical protein